jgi:hypothetical protein
MMNYSRILTHKSTRIIQTLKSIFIISNSVAISRFGFIHVFQMRVLHYELLNSLRPIILR